MWHSHKNTNNVFRLVNPAYDMDMYIFKVMYSPNRLNVNRIPSYVLRSAYSTCRAMHPGQVGQRPKDVKNYLPQAEGVLLRAFDDQSRVRG